MLLADAAVAGLKEEIGKLKTEVARLKGELDVAKATKAKEISEAVFTEHKRMSGLVDDAFDKGYAKCESAFKAAKELMQGLPQSSGA